MTFTPLTSEQFAAIPEAMKTKRCQQWQQIVAELGRAHYARYHAATDASISTWLRRSA